MKNLMEKYINILKNTPLFQGISEAEILPMLKCLSVSIKNYSKFYKYNYDSCYIDYKTNKLNYFFYLRKYYKKS